MCIYNILIYGYTKYHYRPFFAVQQLPLVCWDLFLHKSFVFNKFEYVRKMDMVTDFIFTLRLCTLLVAQARILTCTVKTLYFDPASQKYLKQILLLVSNFLIFLTRPLYLVKIPHQYTFNFGNYLL